MSIPLGEKLLHPMKKIHSGSEDFKKIDVRYIYNGYVKFERDVPFSSLGRYTDFETDVVFVLEEEPSEMKIVLPELIEEIKNTEIVSGEVIIPSAETIQVEDIEKIEEGIYQPPQNTPNGQETGADFEKGIEEVFKGLRGEQEERPFVVIGEEIRRHQRDKEAAAGAAERHPEIKLGQVSRIRRASPVQLAMRHEAGEEHDDQNARRAEEHVPSRETLKAHFDHAAGIVKLINVGGGKNDPVPRFEITNGGNFWPCRCLSFVLPFVFVDSCFFFTKGHGFVHHFLNDQPSLVVFGSADIFSVTGSVFGNNITASHVAGSTQNSHVAGLANLFLYNCVAKERILVLI
jgi:hypothetical protein